MPMSDLERGFRMGTAISAKLARRGLSAGVMRVFANSELPRLAELDPEDDAALEQVADRLAAEVAVDRPQTRLDTLLEQRLSANRQRAGVTENGDLPPAHTVEGRIARNHRAAATPNELRR